MVHAEIKTPDLKFEAYFVRKITRGHGTGMLELLGNVGNSQSEVSLDPKPIQYMAQEWDSSRLYTLYAIDRDHFPD